MFVPMLIFLACYIVESDSVWFFDTASGKEEVLYHWIGNELDAIETMGTLVGAQIEYASQARESSDRSSTPQSSSAIRERIMAFTGRRARAMQVLLDR